MIVVEVNDKTTQNIESILRRIDEIGNAVIASTGERLYKAAATPAPPPQYPIRWDSEKQRRAFFTTRGFGEGIPYKRKGVYERSFGLNVLRNQFTLYTAYPKAIYIGGDEQGRRQSSIHAGRWPVLAVLAMQEAKKAAEEIADAIEKVIKEEV